MKISSKIILTIIITIIFFGLPSLTIDANAGLGFTKMPDCGAEWAKCKDVSVFIVLGIEIGRYLFSIIGALALIMFIYGGFVWITSRGSSEKVKKGMEIFGAAVIGLVIAFSAYMMVDIFGKKIIKIDKQYQINPTEETK